MREEVETVVAQDGWSKASLQKMRKVDSFLKESQRLAGLSRGMLMNLTIQTRCFTNGFQSSSTERP